MNRQDRRKLSRAVARSKKRASKPDPSIERTLKHPDVQVIPKALFVWPVEEFPRRLHPVLPEDLLKRAIWVAFVPDGLKGHWIGTEWLSCQGFVLEDHPCPGGILRVARLPERNPR